MTVPGVITTEIVRLLIHLLHVYFTTWLGESNE